jgi:hypothetical protein
MREKADVERPSWLLEEKTPVGLSLQAAKMAFRLIDSIPYGIWQEMQAEATAWKERAEREEYLHRGTLPEALKREYEDFQHRHLSKVESILDSGVGSCVLRNPNTREIMTETLHHFDGQRYHLHAFAVMPNHVHLAVTPRGTTSWKTCCNRGRVSPGSRSTPNCIGKVRFGRAKATTESFAIPIISSRSCATSH